MSENQARRGSTGRIITIIVVVAAVLVIAAVGYIFVSGGSGEASQQISAPTLEVAQSGENASSSVGQDPNLSGELVVFSIVPEESEVRFSLDEELAGQPVRVVGVTNQVAGQIAINFADPELSQVGVIRINVRTLATDSELRNRAIRGQILQSAQDEFEFATFEPIRVQNFDPADVVIGEPINFEIVGNLTVRNITREVTFVALVTAVDQTRIEGTAATSVNRGDFELTIPAVPNVANVSENVLLEIDIVAVAGDAAGDAAATAEAGA
jgi:polyisoprenoid-binding protein YceI